MAASSKREQRSLCPIASALDLFGDRWTLVLVRDLLNGKRRFGEFLESPERITTNILTDRLAMMEAAGLIEKALYQERPKRYEYRLTEMGRQLAPTLQALCRWSNRFLPGTWTPPERFMSYEPE